MVDDAAAAAYRRYQEEEYERRILQQIKERPSNIMRIRTFEEAKDRWRAADGTSEGITERIDNEAQGVLRKHVLSLNRIRREEVEAMRGQSTAPPIKRWMRNGVNRVALSRVRPRRRSNDAECAMPRVVARRHDEDPVRPRVLRSVPGGGPFEVFDVSDVSRGLSRLREGAGLDGRGEIRVDRSRSLPAGNGCPRSCRRPPHGRTRSAP